MNSGFLTDRIRPARPSTRMDNETYRIRVEDLFRNLYTDEPTVAVAGEKSSGEVPAPRLDESVRQQLQQLALLPRKARHFLRVLNDQPLEVQKDFFRYVLQNVKEKDFPKDLERHIRHRFYEDREPFKKLLATLDDPASIEALMQVIALTEEGWLAGELIRIVLSFDAQILRQPVRNALESGDYLLQCLAIYLGGKSQHDALLEELSTFYRRPFGDKVDRLERKTYDALMEGLDGASDELLLRWLRDGSSRVRELGIVAVAKRRLKTSVGDLVRLVLVDGKTRARAAQTLLDFRNEQLFEFDVQDEGGKAIHHIVTAAKREPLLNMLRELMRDESGAVREATIRIVSLLPDAEPLAGLIARSAVEERLRGVQLAALETLAAIDGERFFDAAAETLSDTSNLHPEVVEGLEQIVEQALTTAQKEKLQEEVAQRRRRREEVLDKFAGTIESWRHDLE